MVFTCTSIKPSLSTVGCGFFKPTGCWIGFRTRIFGVAVGCALWVVFPDVLLVAPFLVPRFLNRSEYCFGTVGLLFVDFSVGAVLEVDCGAPSLLPFSVAFSLSGKTGWADSELLPLLGDRPRFFCDASNDFTVDSIFRHLDSQV